jgi:hypothetical protein
VETISQRKTTSHILLNVVTLKKIKKIPPFLRAFLYFPSGGDVTVKRSRMLNKGTKKSRPSIGQ